MANKPKVIDPRMQELNSLWKEQGLKVKHRKERQTTTASLGSNKNQVRTAENTKTQSYEDGRYAADGVSKYRNYAGTTRNGRLGVVHTDENGNVTKISSADAKTHTMTPKNDDGSAVLDSKGNKRQSGRSKTANRGQRRYDVREGFNNIPERVQARYRELYENGTLTEDEYNTIVGGSRSGGGAGLSNG